MKATVKTSFGNYEVTLEIANYRNNGNLAIQMYCEDGPFATLTVNTDRVLPPTHAFVDLNNCPWAEDFIIEHKLGQFAGDFEMSGFCVYPEWEFDLDELAKYAE